MGNFFYLPKNYMDVKVEDHPIKVENNMEIGFRKTSPAKIEPLQIVKHEFNQLVDNRQCDKSFTIRGDLVKHQRMHKGKKPYQGKQSDKYFIEKGHLLYHQMIHTGVKPYQCNQCDKCYSQKGHLVRY